MVIPNTSDDMALSWVTLPPPPIRLLVSFSQFYQETSLCAWRHMGWKIQEYPQHLLHTNMRPYDSLMTLDKYTCSIYMQTFTLPWMVINHNYKEPSNLWSTSKQEISYSQCLESLFTIWEDIGVCGRSCHRCVSKLMYICIFLSNLASGLWFFLQAGWKLWPFAHLITYGVIPVEQRLLWVDCVELIWVTILST